MPAITDIANIDTEIVITERVVTNQFRILKIEENVADNRLQVEVQLGPFVLDENNNVVRGGPQIGVGIWQNEEYMQHRDSWTNDELITAVKAKLEILQS